MRSRSKASASLSAPLTRGDFSFCLADTPRLANREVGTLFRDATGLVSGRVSVLALGAATWYLWGIGADVGRFDVFCCTDSLIGGELGGRGVKTELPPWSCGSALGALTEIL